MLTRFSVSNFLSFDYEQEFSMLAGEVQKFSDRVIKDKNMGILKFAALYGANASGKSNLIKAIDTAKKILVNGIESINSKELHFKLKSENKEKPSKFEFEIKLNNSYYSYGFSVHLNSSSIVTEWLYELTASKEIMIFERDMGSKKFKTEKKFKSITNESKFTIYSEDIMNMGNVLFLNEISRKNLKEKDFEIFNDIFEWLSKKLIVTYPDTTSSYLKIFDHNDELDILKLLEYFDTGITDFINESSSVEELNRYLDDDDYNHFINFVKNSTLLTEKNKKERIEVKGILRSKRHLFQIKFDGTEWSIKKLLFKHGANSNLLFEFGDESDGTQRLIDLLGIIYDDTNDRTILIDELDRSLHPQMTKKFIETFFKLKKTHSNQLIITTHESSLLNLQLLRRDEIWFVERDKNYSSKLYSLENFKVRFDKKKIDKDYLEGRYGAVPVFKDFDSYLYC